MIVTSVSVCPSGLRGYVQVVMFSNAWVQIPQLTYTLLSHNKILQCLLTHCRLYLLFAGPIMPTRPRHDHGY